MKNAVSIYVIKNLINGKQYVGMTTRIKRRWSEHKGADKSSPILHNALKKYGVENFSFTHVADAFSWDYAQEIERLFIAELNTKVPNGYNLTDGGEGTLGFPAPNKGRPMSEESKEKLRQAHLGKKMSKESSEKKSLATKGKKKAEEHKKKIGLAQKGVPCPQRGRKGKKLSEETKLKLSLAKKGKKLSEETKEKIRQSSLRKKIMQLDNKAQANV
jgi:group I intron endonuclease